MREAAELEIDHTLGLGQAQLREHGVPEAAMETGCWDYSKASPAGVYHGAAAQIALRMLHFQDSQ